MASRRWGQASGHGWALIRPSKACGAWEGPGARAEAAATSLPRQNFLFTAQTPVLRTRIASEVLPTTPKRQGAQAGPSNSGGFRALAQSAPPASQRRHLLVRTGRGRPHVPPSQKQTSPATAAAAVAAACLLHSPHHPQPRAPPQAMCGRSRVSLAPEQVLRAAGTARWVNREAYQPAFNCSPGAATPVVMQAADGVVVHTMRCAGLISSQRGAVCKLQLAWTMRAAVVARAAASRCRFRCKGQPPHPLPLMLPLHTCACRWGLVPSYTKKDERPDFWRMVSDSTHAQGLIGSCSCVPPLPMG